MPVAFDYFELLVCLEPQAHKPLQFLCAFGDKRMRARIVFNQSLFEYIDFEPQENAEPLDELDQKLAAAILENNLEEAIKKWSDFHLFNMPVEPKLITQRIVLS